MKKYFEYVGASTENESGTSSKFWEVTVDGKTVKVRYGRIGTNGQVSTKSFDSREESSKYAEKKIAEKTKEGYQEK